MSEVIEEWARRLANDICDASDADPKVIAGGTMKYMTKIEREELRKNMFTNDVFYSVSSHFIVIDLLNALDAMQEKLEPIDEKYNLK